MKIAMVSSARSPETVKLVNCLVSHGHVVKLFSMMEHRNIHNNIDRRVQVDYLPKGGVWGCCQNAGRLRAQLESFQPDVVHAHYAGGYGVLARRSGVHPLVQTVWSGDIVDCRRGHRLYRKMVYQNLCHADAVVCGEEATEAMLRSTLLYEGDIALLPSGVDSHRFTPKNMYGSSDRIRIGAVCPLEEKRDVELLIRGFDVFTKKLKNGMEASLVIYGSGRQKGAIQLLLDSLELNHKVKLMGGIQHSQLPQVLRQLDVFCVLPTERREIAVTAAMEAMASGVPVVGMHRSGVEVIVEDGETGYLLEQNSSAALADKLYALVWNGTQRQQMSVAGRNHVLAQYDLERNVSKLELLYGRTVNQCRCRTK